MSKTLSTLTLTLANLYYSTWKFKRKYIERRELNITSELLGIVLRSPETLHLFSLHISVAYTAQTMFVYQNTVKGVPVRIEGHFA